MSGTRIEKEIAEIVRKDPRFSLQAYLFMFEALNATIIELGKDKAKGTERHVTGRELLEGIRSFAKEEFGLLAKTVFESWGVRKTENFGEIVFNLVEAGLFHTQEMDTMDDFRDGYDFGDAFEKDYDFEIPWDQISEDRA